MNCKSFTLVEMMIVIAIIGVFISSALICPWSFSQREQKKNISSGEQMNMLFSSEQMRTDLLRYQPENIQCENNRLILKPDIIYTFSKGIITRTEHGNNKTWKIPGTPTCTKNQLVSVNFDSELPYTVHMNTGGHHE